MSSGILSSYAVIVDVFSIDSMSGMVRRLLGKTLDYFQHTLQHYAKILRISFTYGFDYAQCGPRRSLSAPGKALQKRT